MSNLKMVKVFKSNGASEAIAKLDLGEEFFDVHFQCCANGEVQYVPANKIILAALSPVLKDMFYGELKLDDVIEIVDADANEFREFLQFFYLRELTLTIENIETISRLAVMYDIIRYVNACSEYIESQLIMDNMCWGNELRQK